VWLVPAWALASGWDIDPAHSSAQFKVRHMMVSYVKGELSKVSGKVELDERDPTRSQVEATLDAASVDTRNEQRDADLRSANFLDAKRFPTITFKSRSIARAAGSDAYRITGDLTLHGVTRQVVLDATIPPTEVKDPWGNLRRGASATARISRKDFGLTYNKVLEGAGAVVGDEVELSLELELTRKADVSASQ